MSALSATKLVTLNGACCHVALVSTLKAKLSQGPSEALRSLELCGTSEASPSPHAQEHCGHARPQVETQGSPGLWALWGRALPSSPAPPESPVRGKELQNHGGASREPWFCCLLWLLSCPSRLGAWVGGALTAAVWPCPWASAPI